MTNRNHKKLIATLPKLKQVITHLTEIMEDEHDLLEYHPHTIDPEELPTIQDNRASDPTNTLDDNIGTVSGTLETINESFQLA